MTILNVSEHSTYRKLNHLYKIHDMGEVWATLSLPVQIYSLHYFSVLLSTINSTFIV